MIFCLIKKVWLGTLLNVQYSIESKNEAMPSLDPIFQQFTLCLYLHFVYILFVFVGCFVGGVVYPDGHSFPSPYDVCSTCTCDVSLFFFFLQNGEGLGQSALAL